MADNLAFMPHAPSGDLAIFYDATGDPADPPVLLVAGLGQQLIRWEIEAVEDLATCGYFVIRFDHRDVGLSTKLDGKINIQAVFAAILTGRTPSVPYDLTEMGNDGFAVLDHLGIERAHVVGVSMGGMISQRMAIEAPERLADLTVIMSTTGSTSVGQATPQASAFFMRAPASSRDAAITATMEMMRVYWGPHHWDEQRAQQRAADAFDRSFYPEGVGRQFAAMLADGDRTEQLRSLEVPTLVVHGEADPLIDVSGGAAIADAVPDAKLVTFPTMGHDIPPQLWPAVRDELVEHFIAHPA